MFQASLKIFYSLLQYKVCLIIWMITKESEKIKIFKTSPQCY